MQQLYFEQPALFDRKIHHYHLTDRTYNINITLINKTVFIISQFKIYQNKIPNILTMDEHNPE